MSSIEDKQKNLKYGFTELTVIDGWAKNYQCVMNYLNTLHSRQGSAAISLYHFCTWSGLNPDQLLDLKKDYNSLEAEKLLDSLANAKVIFPEKRKWHIAQCLRGFFRTNYRQLQAQAGRSMPYIQNESKSVPSKETRLAVFKACRNPRDQALVMIGTTSAIALESLSKLRFSHFEENWQTQECPHISLPSDMIKGHGKGKYRGVRQETFITTEARNVLIEYRQWMEKTFSHKWKSDDYVFLSIKRNISEPISYRIIAKKATMLEHRASVDFTFHDGRRIVQTALENAGCPNNWIKKIKGRKVSGEEAPYSKPLIEQLRSKYRLAFADLEFLHESAHVLDEKKIRSQMLLDFAKLNGYGVAQLKKLEEALQKAKDPEEAITEFRRLKVEDEPVEKHSEEEAKPSRKPISENIKSTPQQKKYTVAKGETELMQKLDNGWSLVQTIAEDKYLLKF
jgi:hypothetical protein